jgi:chaperonin GroEL (HSP60 family)
MIEEGVIEPRKVVSNAIGCATESAIMILRIDDVISMKGAKGAGMPDMSGMMG